MPLPDSPFGTCPSCGGELFLYRTANHQPTGVLHPVQPCAAMDAVGPRGYSAWLMKARSATTPTPNED